MLRIQKIEISNFVCFDEIEINPSTSEEKPLTVIRAENGSGKTTLLRAIRWGMYGERGLPGHTSHFSLHPAEWSPNETGVETSVTIRFETDGSTRNQSQGNARNSIYELRRSVTTIAAQPSTQGDPDFRRINESTHLLIQNTDGSWDPHNAGIETIVEELLPSQLRDFFVVDADEAADFVGGSENKIIERREVIAKTSFAVDALLGLGVFEKATERVRKIAAEFGRAATKAVGSKELDEKQNELDELDRKIEKLTVSLNKNCEEKDDIDGRLRDAKGHLESLIGALGSHDELKRRMRDNETRNQRARNDRYTTVGALSSELAAIDLLASLASREIRKTCVMLKPLYDDGTIPAHHLTFVKNLLERGECVCGQDLSSPNEFRHHIEQSIEQSRGKEEKANYLAQVLQAANILNSHSEGGEWASKRAKFSSQLAELERDISDLAQDRKEIDAKLSAIDDTDVESTRTEISMLEEISIDLGRRIASDQESLKANQTEKNKLEGIIRIEQRRLREARDFEIYQETAKTVVSVLEGAYHRIREDQVHELSSEMNDLFIKMAANVIDDEVVENDRHKASLRMIAEVGLNPLGESRGRYEIFAHNNRGRSMPPTEINGASRRILALSFVLGLCKVSRTHAPFIADSLLNFMSGSVRTNTLRITAETASQPILLLTGSDLEAQSEVDLVVEHAGATYTLTGQWQHTGQGGDVVNQTDARQVSLLCQCGPREFCDVCERLGYAEKHEWKRKEYEGNQT